MVDVCVGGEWWRWVGVCVGVNGGGVCVCVCVCVGDDGGGCWMCV